MSSEYCINTEVKNRLGDTPLITASQNKYISIVKLLLEKGADIDAVGAKSYTSLEIASFNGSIEIVKLLLEKGGVDTEVDIPLSLSLSKGHKEISKFLIERGADITQGVRYESLIIASRCGYTEIVKLLFGKGVSITQEVRSELLIIASRCGHTGIVKFLIERGADVNSRDKNGDSSLSLACEVGYIKVVKCLLEGIDHSSSTRFKLTEQED